MIKTILKRAIALLGLANFVSVLAFGQTDSTKITIQNRTNLALPGIIELRLHGFVVREEINTSGDVEISVPKLFTGNDVLVVFFRKSSSEPIMRAWSHPINFNGSGRVIYYLQDQDRGLAEQWPAMTWKANKGALDVYMNGEVKGSTELTRGIEPNREHKFEWKRGSGVVCDTTMSLPFNVKRTCTCDEQRKKVTVD